MARKTPALDLPLHANFRLLAQCRRGLFAKLTKRRLKRGVLRSVAELEIAIERFIAEANAKPSPFLWTARPSRILAAVKRGKQALESVH